MRALLLLILIYICLADDNIHYPTNHPGVCNILAFVSDHVEEVVHVAHDEIEAATEISSASPKALTTDIEKVKREVHDMMAQAQCLASDLLAKGDKQQPSATSEHSEQKAAKEQIEVEYPSSSDVKPILKPISSQSAAPEADQTQQHVAEAQETKLIDNVTQEPKSLSPTLNAEVMEKKGKPLESANQPQQTLQHVAETHGARLVRDVAHVLQNVPSLALQTQDKVEVKNEADDAAEYSMEKLQRAVRDVLHVLQSSSEQVSDVKQETSAHLSADKVDEVLLKERPKRRAIELDDKVNETPLTSTNGQLVVNLGQAVSQKFPKRIVRDVAHLLNGEATSSFLAENEVKHESNLEHLKNDYSRAIDILPEETQHVAIKSSSLYAKELFPPTLGQHIDFQGRQKRSIIEEEVKWPTKVRQTDALNENTPRLVRDVSHLFDTSSMQTQAAALQQSSKAAHQHVAVDENVGIHQIPKLLSLRRKRNIEVGRKIAAFTVKEQNNAYQRKSKRSPDESQEIADTNLNSNLETKNEGGTSKEIESNKYIQIIKSRTARYAIEPNAVRRQNNPDNMSSQHVANDDALNKRKVRSSEALSDSSVGTSTQTPTELSPDDIQQIVKPTAKVQQRALPLTQFARRNTFRRN